MYIFHVKIWNRMQGHSSENCNKRADFYEPSIWARITGQEVFTAIGKNKQRSEMLKIMLRMSLE